MGQGHAKGEVELLTPADAGKGRTLTAQPAVKAVPGQARTLPAVSLARAELDLPGDEGDRADKELASAEAPRADERAGVAGSNSGDPGPSAPTADNGTQGGEAVPTAGALAPAPPRRTAEGDSGWFLQLGVFRQLDNALRVQREQMARSTPSDPPVELVQRGDQYRVLLGPYADEADARAVAADIGQRTGHKPGVSRQ